jgi:hypothetical protein
MDPGVFLRNRRVLAGWLATPLTAIMVVFVGVRWYCHQVKETLIEERAMMDILPDLLEAEDRVKEARAAFVNVSSDASGMDQISLLVNAASERYGFNLTSFSISDSIQSKQSPIPFVPVRLSGDGSLLATTQFLDRLQQSEPLFCIEKATIRMSSKSTGQREYVGDFELHYYRLDPDPSS